MGCGLSKEDAEGGAASRCRERKHLLREAVEARLAFAGAHAGHAAALRDVGAALSDYAAAESAAHHDGGGTLLLHSASASAAAVPSVHHAVLPPPPPLPPGADDADPAPLVRSMSAPDLPVPPNLRKGQSGEAPPTIEEDGEGEGEEYQRRPEEEVQPPPPPPPPPSSLPPPTRSPPPVPPPPPERSPLEKFFFGSHDGDSLPPPPPTLDPAAAAESSRAAERRDPALPPPPPPPPAPDQQPPLQRHPEVAEEVAEGKKPAVEAGARRPATQKAARRSERKKDSKMALVAPHQQQAAKLADVLRSLDDHFLKASESTHEVSKLLEAARMHYHSNFAETRGFVDHSARVMQVITWNRSFKGIPQPENVRNELDDDGSETHGTVLDKLLAWEKKLCHEVKEFEVIKVTYQRKLAVLNRKKERGVSPSSIEKTKAVVSHLHTKYIVDLQTLESTVAEINRLRDQQLYPKLLELVKGMGRMWDIMYSHHKTQQKIVSELKSLENSTNGGESRETTEQHHDRTEQLWKVVQEWHVQFANFMMYQKAYVGNLYSWIKLNVIPIDANMKPDPSQPHETTPPIKRLLHAWHDILEKLPDEEAKKAIYTFGEVIHTILVHQEDEFKLRVKVEETRRELKKKRRQFDDWARKNFDIAAGMVPEGGNPEGTRPDPMLERKAAVDRLEAVLKGLEEDYEKQCRVVRDKSANLLRTNLPQLFNVIADFSLHSAGMFKSLWSIAHTNDQLDG